MTKSDLASAEKTLRLFRKDLAEAVKTGDARDVRLCELAVKRQQDMVSCWRDELSRARQPGEATCPADAETEDAEDDE